MDKRLKRQAEIHARVMGGDETPGPIGEQPMPQPSTTSTEKGEPEEEILPDQDLWGV